MKYISTRGNFQEVDSAAAIKRGMVPTGGLFVPDHIPVLGIDELSRLLGLSYSETAFHILKLFLTDYTDDEIRDCIDKAYNNGTFSHPDIAPIVKVGDAYILELWHGPTAAFKDMALQITPQFLAKAIQKAHETKETVILVATSGDTGKAALEGFKNVPGIKIIVFYPKGGVSKVQELQMNTTDGNNTFVVGVKGNFDDCQNAVKEIFGDRDFGTNLLNHGYELSSANSINWGRLLPQIVYYFWAYIKLVTEKCIQVGDKVNFVVPTGNFGNILAGYYAKQMGLPVEKLICASNENKVLTDFLSTGIYDRNREFIMTNSPSMDILISSNLERFLFEITNHDAEKVANWQQQLSSEGRFEIDEDTKQKIQKVLVGGFANQTETMETIKQIYEECNYTLDTHTAVGYKVYTDYVTDSQDQTITIIDSTASPFKFNTAVVQAIKGRDYMEGKDEIQILYDLSDISGLEIHPGLQNLDTKPVLHNKVVEKNEIKKAVCQILGIE